MDAHRSADGLLFTKPGSSAADAFASLEDLHVRFIHVRVLLRLLLLLLLLCCCCCTAAVLLLLCCCCAAAVLAASVAVVD